MERTLSIHYRPDVKYSSSARAFRKTLTHAASPGGHHVVQVPVRVQSDLFSCPDGEQDVNVS